MANGLRYGGLILGVWDKNNEKIGSKIGKGGKNPPSNISIFVLDLKFDVDYDFTAKHDLTLRFDYCLFGAKP